MARSRIQVRSSGSRLKVKKRTKHVLNTINTVRNIRKMLQGSYSKFLSEHDLFVL